MTIFTSLRSSLSGILRPPAAAATTPESTLDVGTNTLARERLLQSGKPLLVVFGPGELDAERPVYRSLLAPVDCNYVIFQSRSTDFFITDWAAIVEHVRTLAARSAARRIVSWGFSMGGYASVRLGLNQDPILDCSVAITPHFRLDAPVSRAQVLRQLPDNAELPDLVDALNRSEGPTRFRIYLPTHSIRDTLHVRDAQQVASANADIRYLNVDHGIEVKWKEDGSLRSAFAALVSGRPWSGDETYTASPVDIATAVAAVDYLYQSHGELRPLQKLDDEGVMEAEWHLQKARAYRAGQDWTGFRGAAFRSLQLGAARGGFPRVYREAFEESRTPPGVAAAILAWTLRYDIEATRELLETPRTLEIIRGPLEFDDLCYLLPFATAERATTAAQQILFRCSDAKAGDLGVFALAVVGLDMADAVERLAHGAAANNVHATADALFARLALMRAPSASDREAWQRTRAAIGLPPPSPEA